MSDTRLIVGWMNAAQKEAHKRMQQKLNVKEHRFFSGRSDIEDEEEAPIVDSSIMCLYDIGWGKGNIAIHLNLTLAYVKSVITRELYRRGNIRRRENERRC